MIFKNINNNIGQLHYTVTFKFVLSNFFDRCWSLVEKVNVKFYFLQKYKPIDLYQKKQSKTIQHKYNIFIYQIFNRLISNKISKNLKIFKL